MNDDKVIPLSKPAETVQDVLTDLLRTGVKQLLAEALEIEIQEQLAHYRSLKTEGGLQAVVRNGYLPERTIQTGIGSV